MEWYQAVIVFAVAFAVAYCMVPVSKKIAFRIGAIDYPGYRRMNREPIPRCGGIALYVGLIAACFTMFLGVRFFDWDLHDLYILSDVNYIVLFIGVTTMFTVGLVDDITQLSPGVKLAGQIVAATVVTLSGITIGAVRTLVDYLSLGWIDYPLTVLYLVVFVNITNLIDGLDGLASGLVAIVAGGLLYLVLMRGSFTLVLVCLALIAVCLAFLRYNFFPASVFMGDSGSLLLGLVVGIVSVVGVVRTQSFVVMLVPLIIAGVPVLDTVSAGERRRFGAYPSSSHARRVEPEALGGGAVALLGGARARRLPDGKLLGAGALDGMHCAGCGFVLRYLEIRFVQACFEASLRQQGQAGPARSAPTISW